MWKQPIPVEIPELADNPFAENIFINILKKCANETREVRTDKGIVTLERGECLFGRFEFNQMFGLPDGSQKIEKELKKSPFLNRYINRCIERGKGSVLQVKDYDEWVNMNRLLNTEQTQSEHRVNTNKSAKSDKSISLGRKKILEEEDLTKIAKDLKVSLKAVKASYDVCVDWFKSKGKYEGIKDMSATLRNWIRKDIKDGKLSNQRSLEDILKERNPNAQII